VDWVLPSHCRFLVALGLGLSCLTAGPAAAQTDSTDADPAAGAVARVERAFGNGDAEVLLAPASDRVEVSLLGTRTFYSRSQAFYVLRDFFAQYEPRRFEVRDVSKTGASTFITGRYRHARADDPLPVYVRLQQNAGTGDPPSGDPPEWVLHEVRVGPVR
jgi:hypothetical protein